VKVLFQLPYPGYLRIYGSTVRELAARGHTVELAYDSGKHRDPTAEATESLPGVVVVGRVPERQGARRPALPAGATPTGRRGAAPGASDRSGGT